MQAGYFLERLLIVWLQAYGTNAAKATNKQAIACGNRETSCLGSLRKIIIHGLVKTRL
jgi:hypothetical protein